MSINQISSLFSNYCDYGLKGNPDEDLKTLGMTKEEARAKFGDPQKPDNSSVFEGYCSPNNGSLTLADYFDIAGEAYADENEGLSTNKKKGFFGDIVSKFIEKPDSKDTSVTLVQTFTDENKVSTDETKSKSENQFGKTDPDTYAQEYANKHNMTLEEAKAELKSKYGDPKAPSTSSNSKNSSSATDSIPQGVDPDTYAQEYANKHNMTLEEAKAELKSKYGDPKAKESNNTENTENTDETEDTENFTKQEQELLNKGIPAEIIKKGNDAIRKYAKDHNIELKNPK